MRLPMHGLRGVTEQGHPGIWRQQDVLLQLREPRRVSSFQRLDRE